MFYNNNPYINYPYANTTLPYNPAQQITPNNVMQAPQSTPVAPATTPVQQTASRQSNCEWIYVNGLSGVREHIVQPNQTLYFLDNNNPIFYKKVADNFGTAQIKAYRFTEITEPAPQNDEISDNTKSEIAEIKSRLDRLEGAINNESSDK